MCGTRKPCPKVQRKLSLNKMKNRDNSKQRLLTEGNWLLGKRERIHSKDFVSTST